MRKMLLALVGVATLALFGATKSDAQTFCYNKVTGAFNHWGKCGVVSTFTAQAAGAEGRLVNRVPQKTAVSTLRNPLAIDCVRRRPCESPPPPNRGSTHGRGGGPRHGNRRRVRRRAPAGELHKGPGGQHPQLGDAHVDAGVEHLAAKRHPEPFGRAGSASR